MKATTGLHPESRLRMHAVICPLPSISPGYGA